MNIQAAIIDQRLSAVMEEIRERAREELRIVQDDRLKSLAFVYLCVKTILDLPDEEGFDCLTEGGQDFGVDAIHIGEEHDGEFTVSLFQGKYKHDLAGTAAFPENGIKSLINAVTYLFDPSAKLTNVNLRLQTKVEEARSLIRDGYIPQIRALACNNGAKYDQNGQNEIDRAAFGPQVTWEHFNHEWLVKILQAPKPVNDTLQLTGRAIVEDFNFSRVILGRIAVTEIAALIERHGERLLERNIRRYLGLQGNRVNEGIYETLRGTEKSNFYFYNNGITLTCDKFAYNNLQSGDFLVRVENLQIINGGQTCMTIYKTLQEPDIFTKVTEAFVLVRLYQLPSDNDDLVRQITFATNSQNPVDLRDLRANDEKQQRLQLDMEQLGYAYRRKRTDTSLKSTDITSGVAAEAILSVWRKRPHQAKFFAREHFGKLYDDVFTRDLNGSQTILAALIHRHSENKRKRPPNGAPAFLSYASCFIGMQMGKYLLKDMNCTVDGINHQTFSKAVETFEKEKDRYFERALTAVDEALHSLYGETHVSLQQLAATFRRGDLIAKLDQIT